MTEFHVLVWALSLLFCMAMGFVILLWCRSWRREEREATAQQIESLSREVRRLAVAVDGMDETAASLLAADEQLADDIERLREQVRLFRSAQARATAPAGSDRLASQSVRASVATPGVSDEPVGDAADDETDLPDDARYDQVRRMLRGGATPLEVARELQMGAAEVRMIARMMGSEDP